MAQSLSVKEKKSIIAEMTPALRKVHSKVAKLAAKLSESDVLGRYDIGQALLSTKDEREFGTEAIETISAATGGKIGTVPTRAPDLYAYQSFANAFSRKAVETLLGKVTKGGNKLSYTHFRLLSLAKDAKRKPLVKICFAEDLTTAELELRVTPHTSGRVGRSGRKITPPKSVVQGLRQICKYPQDVHKRISVWDKAVFDKIKKAAPDSFDADSLAQIRDAQKHYAALVSDSQHIIARLEKAEARVSKVLSKRENGEPVPEKKKVTTAKKKKKAKVTTPNTEKKAPKTKADKVKAAKKKKKSKTPSLLPA